MIKIRTHIILSQMQPQLASYIATTTKGFMPIPGHAAFLIEVEPGMMINLIMDKILKNTKVIPGMMVIERAYGLLEVHHENQSEIDQAVNAVFEYLQIKEKNQIKLKIVSNQIIHSVSPYHAQLLNKIRYGTMIIPGESLFILETEPAGYVALAANEAEKAGDIKLIEMRCFGAYGRLYISGQETMVDCARNAALISLQNIIGIE